MNTVSVVLAWAHLLIPVVLSVLALLWTGDPITKLTLAILAVAWAVLYHALRVGE